MIKIEEKESYGLLDKLAHKLGTTVSKGVLKIPEDQGNGYMQGFLFDNKMSMMVRNCEIKSDIHTIRRGDPSSNSRILLSFHNVLHETEIFDKRTEKKIPSVQIGVGKINFETFYPSKTRFRSILLAIENEYLKKLVNNTDQHPFLNKILSSNQELIFEEFISPTIQKVALEIAQNDIPECLHSFYYRLKAEELICLLFAELLKRENNTIYSLNEIDVKKIYQIREKMFIKLSVPPILSELAKEAGMSESKLKRLFKQIFGNSLFNYYQDLRMKEASRLLKEKKMTVSEVGYHLGFTNLSHFSKIFEEHIGMKPKKYSLN